MVQGVGSSADESREVAHLRREAAQAALDDLSDLPADVAAEICRVAVLQYRGHLEAQKAMEDARLQDGLPQEESAEKLSALLRRATDVERTVVLDRRRRGVVSAAVADEVLRDVETRAMRDFG